MRIPANKGKKYPPEPLARSEVSLILRQCSNRYPTGIRNRALIAVMYRAGLRVAETLDLCPKDLNADQGTIRILNGKGEKARVVGMDPDGFAMVDRWLTRRDSLGIDRTKPLFCTLGGRRLSESYIRVLLPRLARKAGIDKRVHAHGLRHTHALELASEGTPLPIIQTQLGHSSAATTAVYLRGISPTEVIQTMQKRKWTEDE